MQSWSDKLKVVQFVFDRISLGSISATFSSPKNGW